MKPRWEGASAESLGGSRRITMVDIEGSIPPPFVFCLWGVHASRYQFGLLR